jgi:hypothetical protein
LIVVVVGLIVVAAAAVVVVPVSPEGCRERSLVLKEGGVSEHPDVLFILDFVSLLCGRTFCRCC